MKTPLTVAAIAVAAFAGAVAYLKRDIVEQPSATAEAASASVPGRVAASERAAGAAHTSGARGNIIALTPGAATSSGGSQNASPALSDPRLAALKVSPDNGLIEFVKAPDGAVIAEIDKDPSSHSFRRPLREYMYSQGRVVGLTSYRYVGDRVEIMRTVVSYKPDGSVDEIRESSTN